LEWFVFVVLLLVNAGSTWADDNPNCSIPTALTKSRPNSDGPPTPVRIAIRLIDIGGINEVSEEFNVDFLAMISWEDPRLSVQEIGYSLDKCTVLYETIWHPFVDIINGILLLIMMIW
jgi:hypothetical protein